MPIQNSNEAKPKIKKLVLYKVKSSLIVPRRSVYVYNETHVISEKINKLIKLLGFKQKPKIETQRIIFQ